jgi:hypothetical protein
LARRGAQADGAVEALIFGGKGIRKRFIFSTKGMFHNVRQLIVCGASEQFKYHAMTLESCWAIEITVDL